MRLNSKFFYILLGITVAFVGMMLIVGVVYPALADGTIYLPIISNGSSDVNSASADVSAQPINTPTPDLTGVKLDPTIRVTPPAQDVLYETIDLAPEVPFEDKYFLLVDDRGKMTAFLLPEAMLEAKLKEVGYSYLVLEVPPSELQAAREKEATEQLENNGVRISIPVDPPPTVEIVETPVTDISKVTPPSLP